MLYEYTEVSVRPAILNLVQCKCKQEVIKFRLHRTIPAFHLS